MFIVDCYSSNKCESYVFTNKEEAFVYAELLFNAGANKVKVYDENMNIILEL